jgi:multimeric flavodoxin WrbA
VETYNTQEQRSILAILGSPRRRGNSDTLAHRFLEGAESRGFGHDLIIPTDLGLSPCDGQNQCFEDGRCVIRDGINEIYERVLRTPRLLIATPVYFMGPPGSLKSFMDRFQAVWARSAILKAFDPDGPKRRADHKGFAIIVGATRENPAMYRPTRSIIKAFFNVTGFEYAGDLISTGLDKAGDATSRPDLLDKAFAAGQAFAS